MSRRGFGQQEVVEYTGLSLGDLRYRCKLLWGRKGRKRERVTHAQLVALMIVDELISAGAGSIRYFATFSDTLVGQCDPRYWPDYLGGAYLLLAFEKRQAVIVEQSLRGHYDDTEGYWVSPAKHIRRFRAARLLDEFVGPDQPMPSFDELVREFFKRMEKESAASG